MCACNRAVCTRTTSCPVEGRPERGVPASGPSTGRGSLGVDSGVGPAARAEFMLDMSCCRSEVITMPIVPIGGRN
jgi:hypothetical protein